MGCNSHITKHFQGSAPGQETALRPPGPTIPIASHAVRMTPAGRRADFSQGGTPLQTLYVLSVLSVLYLASCTTYQPVPLTVEGAHVIFIGSELAQNLPGRPLDKCKITGHIELQEPPKIDPCMTAMGPGGAVPYCRPVSDLENMLRNDAAAKQANAVIFTGFIHTSLGAQGICPNGIRGIAIQCDEKTVKDAGFGK